jgi:hypothetical protein
MVTSMSAVAVSAPASVTVQRNVAVRGSIGTIPFVLNVVDALDGLPIRMKSPETYVQA